MRSACGANKTHGKQKRKVSPAFSKGAVPALSIRVGRCASGSALGTSGSFVTRAGKKLTGKQNGKFRSSLFKGLQVEGSALVALRRARNTFAAIPPQGVNPKNSPVDCFWRGDALGKRASPCRGHHESNLAAARQRSIKLKSE